MPLITSSWETLKDDIKNAPSSEVIVVFSGAKNEEGESWCPPCNAAAPSYKSNLEDNADVRA
jgi:thiol-disulfide isomerase/thioredoxin